MLFDQLEKQEEKDSQDSDIKEPESKLPPPVTACPVRKNIHPVRNDSSGGNKDRQTRRGTSVGNISNGAGEDKDISDKLKHNTELSNGVKMQEYFATAGEKETQNFIVVTEEEFITAKRLLSNQRLNAGEQRYHRDRPVRAEKIDDNEFTFYTDDSLKQEK